ncbi:MAG: LPS assembly lipoprotein LptE [Puniceicoccales bacterium]|jgi:hypothetical protein|nr:LPS assembly lipoprotein LptE [Puniceicoccales bacterium]
MIRSILFFILAIIAGCTHYHRGASLEDVAQSIYVEPVKNSSLCPKASSILTPQLIKNIQQNTSLKLTPKEKAQLHLQVEVVDFSQKSSTYNPDDTAQVLSFDLRIAAECTLIDKNGRLLLDHQRFETSMDLEKEKNFHLLRDQAIPPLMERLARKICAAVVNIW